MSTTIDPPADAKVSRRKRTKKTKKSKKAASAATSDVVSSAPRVETGLSPLAAAERAACWRATAPKSVRKAGLPPADQWRAFAKRGSRAKQLGRLLRTRRTPLAWGLDAVGLSPICRRLWDALDTDAKQRRREKATSRTDDNVVRLLADWLALAEGEAPRLDLAVSSVAAAHVLAAVARHVEPQLAWQLLDALWRVAFDAQGWARDAESSADDALARELIAGELSLALSYLFADLAPMHGLRAMGRQQLAAGLDEILNGDGLPRAHHLPIMRALVASWTRSAAIGRTWSKGPWPARTQKEFAHAVQQAIRWTSPVGGQLLAAEKAAAWPTEFLRAAVRLSGSKAAAASACTPVGRPKKSSANRAKRKGRAALQPADDSDWCGLAVLRTDWSKRATTLAVDYSGETVRLEAWVGNRRLLSGDWAVNSTADGAAVQPAGPWEQVCWSSESDCDYLELCQPLVGGGQLDRQILLARRDGVLYLCDHLRSERTARLSHAQQLPLASGVVVAPADETREVQLSVGGRTLRAMPLALPEWRIEAYGGDLVASGDKLELRRESAGHVVACPLLVDLDPRRAKKHCTWRQLTVAENLALQTPDVAVAYRAQCGVDQWVFYRSQAKRGNRTFIGQNTSSEFLAGRFKSNGSLKELVEIEG